jgi:glycosyltransferase XagB
MDDWFHNQDVTRCSEATAAWMLSPLPAPPADLRLWLHAAGFFALAALTWNQMHGGGALRLIHDIAYTFFAVLIIHRIGLCLIGIARPARAFSQTPGARRESDGDTLPTYALLIALRHEVAAASGLVAALKRIDYPPQRLKVYALVEADDPETADALLAAGLPEWMQVIIVPEGQPRTKARALNFGLTLTDADFIAVYDAEDIPHPAQLRAAVAAFRDDPELACVQAPLVIHNGGAGWLSRQFSLEYAVHFGQLVPGKVALGLPVLLGGTSNHFRTSVLNDLRGQDPYNVTEDAELGIRLAYNNYRIGHIAPPTLEEAPEHIHVWLAQRSRWLKGYTQSFATLLRLTAVRPTAFSFWAQVHLWLMLGGAALAAAVHGPLILIVLVAMGLGLEVALMDLGLLGAGYLAGVLGHGLAIAQRTSIRLGDIIATLTLPLYWPLQSAALARALWGLATNPAYWAKTPHKAHPHKLDAMHASAE